MGQGERVTAAGDFGTRVRLAMADDHLRDALDRATGLFTARRSAALASLENADAVRDAARAARLGALAHLAENLERFEAKLAANGAQVHWAETPDEANRIVAGIAAATGTRVAVKSKSMVSEETHLNAALERAGVEVIETDLGEYIVQLAHDRPSHIIAPIIHLTRQDVGRVMAQQLHVPYTDETRQLICYDCPLTKVWEKWQRHEGAGGTLADFDPGYSTNECFNYFWNRRPARAASATPHAS